MLLAMIQLQKHTSSRHTGCFDSLPLKMTAMDSSPNSRSSARLLSMSNMAASTGGSALVKVLAQQFCPPLTCSDTAYEHLKQLATQATDLMLARPCHGGTQRPWYREGQTCAAWPIALTLLGHEHCASRANRHITCSKLRTCKQIAVVVVVAGSRLL